MKLRGGMMPPQGMPRPDDADARGVRRRARDRRSIVGALRHARIRATSRVHRLNRTEYGNAIRDLLDLDDRRHRPAAGRRREQRVRQHRRRAARLAVAARAVPRRRRARSAAWRSASDKRRRPRSAIRVPPDDSQEDHVEGLPLGTRGGLLVPPQLPAGRRVRVQRLPAAQHRRLHDRARVRASARDLDRRRARVHRAGRRRGGQPGVGQEHVRDGQQDRRAAEDARQGEGRAAHGGRDVRQAESRRVGRAAAAARARSRSAGHERPAADRSRQRDRPVQRRPGLATRRAAAASSPAGRRRPREEAACARDDPVDARAPRLSAAGHRPPTWTPIMALYEDGPEEGHVRRRHRAGPAADPGEPEVPVPHRDARRSDARPAARSPTSSWRRGCRSSSGAPSPTTSCSTLAAQGTLSQPAVLERQVRRMLADPQGARARRQLRQPVADAAQPARATFRRRATSRTSTTSCARRSGRRPSCSSRASCARTAASSICSTPTTRSSTSGWRGTTASRTSTAATSAA